VPEPQASVDNRLRRHRRWLRKLPITQIADSRAPAAPPSDGRAEPKRPGAGLALLVLLPIACCGLPLMITVTAAAGVGGAVLGGVAGAVLLIAAALVFVLTIRRRRTAACRTSPTMAMKDDEDRSR
jgi:hypothetical protein